MSHNLAIFASGSGSTAARLITDLAETFSELRPILLICNNKSSKVFERVDELNSKFDLNIKTECINAIRFPFTDEEKASSGSLSIGAAEEILNVLKENNIDHITLLGYMKKLSSKIIDLYADNILNTHPGLLPDTKGLWGINTQKFVLENNHKFAGQTLHKVAYEYDEGEIIAENKIKVLSTYTPEILFEKVQEIEKDNIAKDVANYFLQSR
jgi:phosphoribosylglycinamide formyltransferase-1